MTSANPQLNTRYQKNLGATTGWFEVLANELQTDADRTSGQFDNVGSVGLLLWVKTANEAAAASVTPSLRMYGPDGAAIILWTAAAAITANGTFVYLLHPGDPNGMGTGVTETAGVSIPRRWYVYLDYTGTPNTDMIDTQVQAAYV